MSWQASISCLSVKLGQLASQKDKEIEGRKKLAANLESEGLYEEAIKTWLKILEIDSNNRQPLIHIENLKNKIEQKVEKIRNKEKEEIENKKQLLLIEEKEKEEKLYGAQELSG